MACDAHTKIGGTSRPKVQRYSLNIRWSIPTHSVHRSLEFMDTIYKITLGFLGLLLLLIFAALFWFWRRENRLSQNEERTRREQELADAEMERVRRESILSVLPSKFFKTDWYSDQDTSQRIPQNCPICLESFKDGTEISSSKNDECIHVFHKLCITDWFLRNEDHLCPMCRCNFLQGKVDTEQEVNEEAIPRLNSNK